MQTGFERLPTETDATRSDPLRIWKQNEIPGFPAGKTGMIWRFRVVCAHLKRVFFAIFVLAVACSVSELSAGSDADRGSATAYFGQKPPGLTPVLFAPGIVSTEGYDISPTFAPTLDEVFWGRRATEAGSDNRLYYSRITDGEWSTPALAPFATNAMEFEAQFSVDGNTVYYNRDGDLYHSERMPDGWSEGKQLTEPVAEGMCVACASNGSIYFTAARNRKYGIWRSERQNSGLAEPELIIPFAAHPCVAPDESFVLFDRYDESRASKLYASFRDENDNWSEPIPFDTVINATGTELIAKLSPDGNYLFFQRKVNNNTDIYWVDVRVVSSLRESSAQ